MSNESDEMDTAVSTKDELKSPAADPVENGTALHDTEMNDLHQTDQVASSSAEEHAAVNAGLDREGKDRLEGNKASAALGETDAETESAADDVDAATASPRRRGLRDRSKITTPSKWTDEMNDATHPDILSGNYTVKEGLVYNKNGHVLMTAERFLAMGSANNSPRRPVRRARHQAEIEEQRRSNQKKQEEDEKRQRRNEVEEAKNQREQLRLETAKLKLEQLKMREQERARREADKLAKQQQDAERQVDQQRKQKEKATRDEERLEKDKQKQAEQQAQQKKLEKQQQILKDFVVVKRPAGLSQILSQCSSPMSQSKATVDENGNDISPGSDDADTDIIAIKSFFAQSSHTYLGPFISMHQRAPMSAQAQGEFISMLEAQNDAGTTPAAKNFLDEIATKQRSYATHAPIIQHVERDIDRHQDLLDGFRTKTTGIQIVPSQLRIKFLKFFEEYRPGYYGTKLNKSGIISACDPFRKDSKLLDYDFDSDDEWDQGIDADKVEGIDECSDAESLSSRTGECGAKKVAGDKDAAGNDNADDDDDDEDDSDDDEEGFIVKDEDAWKAENAFGVSIVDLLSNNTNPSSAGDSNVNRFDLSMKYYNSRTKKQKQEKRVPRLLGPFYADVKYSPADLRDFAINADYFQRLSAIKWIDPDTNELGVACRTRQAPPAAVQGTSQQQQQRQQQQVGTTKASLVAMRKKSVQEEDEDELKILSHQQRQKLVLNSEGNLHLVDVSTLIFADGILVNGTTTDNNNNNDADGMDRLTMEDQEELVEIYDQVTRQASDWHLPLRDRRQRLRREAKVVAMARGVYWRQPPPPPPAKNLDNVVNNEQQNNGNVSVEEDDDENDEEDYDFVVVRHNNSNNDDESGDDDDDDDDSEEDDEDADDESGSSSDADDVDTTNIIIKPNATAIVTTVVATTDADAVDGTASKPSTVIIYESEASKVSDITTTATAAPVCTSAANATATSSSKPKPPPKPMKQQTLSLVTKRRYSQAVELVALVSSKKAKGKTNNNNENSTATTTATTKNANGVIAEVDDDDSVMEVEAAGKTSEIKPKRRVLKLNSNKKV